MQVDAKFLLEHLQYSQWASERSIEAVRPLTIEEQNRYLYTSYHGVLETLVHIYKADRVWLSRLDGSPRLTLADLGETFTLDTLALAWATTHAGFESWAGALTDDAVTGILKYVNLQGNSYELPVWQVILHVVNHASYHRGQITTMLRQLNHKPIGTDLAAYYNSR